MLGIPDTERNVVSGAGSDQLEKKPAGVVCLGGPNTVRREDLETAPIVISH